MRQNYTANLLRHFQHVTACASDAIPNAPIMVDIEPSGRCNLNCEWCCQAYWRLGKHLGPMPWQAMWSLPSFLARWGVLSARIAGAGEPCMSPYLSQFIADCKSYGIAVGLITNGVLLNRVTEPALGALDWLGVSLDAGRPATWAKLKDSDPCFWDAIVGNIRYARDAAPDLPITVKFLRYKDNVKEVEQAKALAESLGCDFRERDCYPKDYAASYRFTRCRATALGGVFCSNLNFQLCCDRRGSFTLVEDFTDYNRLLEAWGSDQHKALIDSIDPTSCRGCAKRTVNETLENVCREGAWTSEMQVDFI